MKQQTKKLSLYLETSVWNFIYADDAPDKRDITKVFFREVEQGRYDIFISDLVATEIGNANEAKRKQLESLIKEYKPVQLTANQDVEKLSNAYLEANIVPKKFPEDIIHAAYAVAHNLDAIVSWNLKHIVKLKTKMAVNGINKLLGYREIEIVTPEEVVGYGT